MYHMAARLSFVNNLYFPPPFFTPCHPRQGGRPLFVEQYGGALHSDELTLLDMLRADLVVISEHVEEGELVRVQRAAVLLDEERGVAREELE